MSSPKRTRDETEPNDTVPKAKLSKVDEAKEKQNFNFEHCASCSAELKSDNGRVEIQTPGCRLCGRKLCASCTEVTQGCSDCGGIECKGCLDAGKVPKGALSEKNQKCAICIAAAGTPRNCNGCGKKDMSSMFTCNWCFKTFCHGDAEAETEGCIKQCSICEEYADEKCYVECMGERHNESNPVVCLRCRNDARDQLTTRCNFEKKDGSLCENPLCASCEFDRCTLHAEGVDRSESEPEASAGESDQEKGNE